MAQITKQIKGIDIKLDPDILEDWDVLNDLMTLVPDDEGVDPDPKESREMLMAVNRLANTLYGKNFENIKKKLRTANGGKLPFTLVTEFINDTFVAFQAKNS